MKKVIYIVVLTVFSLSGWLVFAHGTETGTDGSSGMMRMMDMMHESIDNNHDFNCESVSDMEMMEEGEEMMEEMMGHEDHEKMEEAMNEEDHDSMHTMMGMWASGCIGDETMNTMMERYSVPRYLENGYQNQTNWSSMLLGIILGLIGGWAGSQLLRKKSAVN